MTEDVAYRIVQNGVPIARAEGQHSLREIMLATRTYAQDGPLSIQKRIKRHWRGFGVMDASSIPSSVAK